MPIITAVSSPTTALITSTSDASGNISYVTANTTAMVIDTNQNTTHIGYVSAPNTFGFKNRIMNGHFIVDQRGLGTANNTTDGLLYTPDRWNSFGQQANKFSTGTTTDAPVGFNKSIIITSLSSYAVQSTDRFIFRQSIEGYNLSDLNWGTSSAVPVTLSFWVKSSLTGTHGGSLLNGGQARAYLFTYNITTANTWQFISITIPGDTQGTWPTDNTAGFKLWFTFGAGSNYTTTAPNQWASGNLAATTGLVQLVATSGATWQATGIQLERGSIATSFDWRPYGTELQLCQRYYFQFNNNASYNNMLGSGYATSSSAIYAYIQFLVPMRSYPTSMTTDGTGTDYDVNQPAGLTICSAVPTLGSVSNFGATVTFNGTSFTSGQVGLIRLRNSTSYLGFSAEI